LYEVAINNQLGIVQYLVDLGASPDHSPPLSVTAMRGHLDVLHCLLTHGWDVNQFLTHCFKPAINHAKSASKVMLEDIDLEIFALRNKKQ